MAKKKKELGRGIKALLSNIETNNTKLEKKLESNSASSTSLVKLSKIEANPDQPRRQFDLEALQELADSIKVHGIIQPITVRRFGGTNYQIISGERRYRAAKLAKLVKVPVYIREADDVTLLEMALIENIQRADLNAIEIAISYQRLIEECDITHEDLSGRVGKKRSTVSNYIRLLKLPASVQTALKNQKISMGHARVIAGQDNTSDKLLLFNKIIKQGLSVRAAEAIAKHDSKPKSKSQKSNSSGLTSDVIKIKDQLSAKFGSKVIIERSAGGKGKFIIPFKSDNDFNDIIDTILED